MTQQLATEPEAGVAQAPTSLLTAVQRWPDNAARDWTLGAVEQAMFEEAIKAIIATGSSVRDVEFSDDLDLVFVYKHSRPATPRPPISIDLRGYGEAQVARKLAEGHDYLSWTVRFGQILFERECWWTRLRADWNDRLCLPSVADARTRAEKAECLSKELREAGDEEGANELQWSSLTNICRAELIRARVFPKSRPELDGQLREIGRHELADQLASGLERRRSR